MSMREEFDRLRAIYPHFGPARYLYAHPSDLRKRGADIVLISLLTSEDERASLHSTQFHKTDMTVNQWADWLETNAPDIMTNQVIAYVNRNHGSDWSVERIVGWHFIRATKKQREAQKRRKRPQ
jgi:hypothetical protein